MSIKDVLIDSVLSGMDFRLLRNYEEEKPKIEEPEPDPYVPPEPITCEKIKELNSEAGTIYTCFPENHDSQFVNLPKIYYTLSSKEKILLLFIENFRRQFKEIYPNRRPLVLALLNECHIQKCVCTTISPTTFVNFPILIDNWIECASFVADHILFEPLENPTKIPTRLLSPEIVLKDRKGNSFEIATLLCSILIGFGFPAMVVSGYATREVTHNDQRRVTCPYKIDEKKEIIAGEEKEPKYKLKGTPFLKSKFLLEVERKKLKAENENQEEINQQKRLEIEELERPPSDPENGFRSHAWVVMIKNAPWCYKPEFTSPKKQTFASDTDDEDHIEPTAFFIEPSTGFRHEVEDPCYQGIESIWNHQNYYVNRQYPDTSIADMKWDLADTFNWEHLLAGEPFEMRQARDLDEDQDLPTEDEILATEKHLDMPFSWVDILNISAPDFEERFLNGEKKELYKYSTYEKFAPYKNKDGLMRRSKSFETLEYENPLVCLEFYENRDDLMETIRVDLKTNETQEVFATGRSDSLQSYVHYPEQEKKIVLRFYPSSRFDCLKELIFHATYIEEHYENRRDLLFYRKFFIKEKDPIAISRGISKIIEKFHRKDDTIAVQDIAIRHFNRDENKIFVQFHYGEDCITATTKEFTKPPKSEDDFRFDAQLVAGYISNPWEKQMTGLELYYLLQKLLKDEEKSMDAFHARFSEVEDILVNRERQIKFPLLKFSIFDPLRNDSARKLRLQRFEQMKTREELAKKQQADFLAPYLVRFEDQKPVKEDLDRAVDDCLKDFQKNFVEMVNELQRRYDESTGELNSLKRFLHRYMDQFTVTEYDKFIIEGENIERYRKIIQQRIVAVKEESKRKYANLQESIKTDSRLQVKEAILKFQDK
ncbi:unnamed protein product [Diamesa tonsa]